MDILSININDIKIYPSVTDNYVNINIKQYSGSIQTEIYNLSGYFIGTQSGNKLSFKNFNAGVYFCIVNYGEKKKNFKIVKL